MVRWLPRDLGRFELGGGRGLGGLGGLGKLGYLLRVPWGRGKKATRTKSASSGGWAHPPTRVRRATRVPFYFSAAISLVFLLLPP